jgi:hypothetical protein
MSEILKSSVQGQGLCPFVLFHGTDLTIWELSSQKRADLNDSCWKILNYLGPEIREMVYVMRDPTKNTMKAHDFEVKFRQIFGNDEYPAFAIFDKAVRTIDKEPNYRHNGFYVTNILNRAKRFALEAVHFGEIGFLAYQSRVLAERIGLDLHPITDEVEAAIDTTMWYEKLEHKPVVYCLEGVAKSRLMDEDGEKFPFKINDEYENNEGCSFLLPDFDLANPEKIKISIQEV